MSYSIIQKYFLEATAALARGEVYPCEIISPEEASYRLKESKEDMNGIAGDGITYEHRDSAGLYINKKYINNIMIERFRETYLVFSDRNIDTTRIDATRIDTGLPVRIAQNISNDREPVLNNAWSWVLGFTRPVGYAAGQKWLTDDTLGEELREVLVKKPTLADL